MSCWPGCVKVRIRFAYLHEPDRAHFTSVIESSRIGELWPEVEARYGASPLIGATQLGGGQWNDVFRVETAEGFYVLRYSHPTAIQRTVAFTHDVMASLAPNVPEIAPPIRALDGSTFFADSSRLVTLFPYIEGARFNRSTVDVSRVGALLGGIHRASASLPFVDNRLIAEMNWESNFLWDWSAVERILATARGRSYSLRLSEESFDLLALRNEFESWIGGLRSEDFPRGITHGDFYAGNLIGDEEGISGVIDWDECRVEWLFWEVGRALWEFCGDPVKASFDLGRSTEFLSAYKAANPPPIEVNLLPPVMKFCRLVDVLFDLTEAGRTGELNDETMDYHLANLRCVTVIDEIDSSLLQIR